MGSKDKGRKEVRKPKSAKKKEKAAPVIQSRVRVTEPAPGGEKDTD